MQMTTAEVTTEVPETTPMVPELSQEEVVEMFAKHISQRALLESKDHNIFHVATGKTVVQVAKLNVNLLQALLQRHILASLHNKF